LRLCNREACCLRWRIQRSRPTMIWLAESKGKTEKSKDNEYK
jgi:hypothetical protein